MLQVRLLGQFDVRIDDQPIHISSRTGQALFAYLVLTAGTLHRRERLAGVLWPDSADDTARHNLRTELWRVRKTLGASAIHLRAEELTVSFEVDADVWLDVAQLDRPTAPDGLNDLGDQLELYRGDLLPGFYDDWIVLEREHVQAVFERKMQQWLEVLCGSGDWVAVQHRSERWIALGHTPEPAYRALMIAGAALGNRSKVVATFERCRSALTQELGVPPSAETMTLYERLVAGEGVEPIDFSAVPASTIRVRQSIEPPAPGTPPFKGLAFFDEADADLFFGREALTARLVDHLRASPLLMVIVGASGSGKSSIVRAGLIPALKKGGPFADSAARRFKIMTPTAQPLRALAETWAHGADAAALWADMSRTPQSLRRYIQRELKSASVPRAVLVVDQFEELFALCHDDFERETFIDNLLALIAPEAENSLTLIMTLRADFYSYVAQYPELREAIARQQIFIGAMLAEELRRAIEEPARRGGWDFEPGLIDLMLRDAGADAGALPLLSYALLETWQRRSGHRLMLKGYAESGGVQGAIASTADTVYRQLPAEQQRLARQIFLRLTELGEGTQDTRRRATIQELIGPVAQADQIRTVLKALADARLVTTGAETVEVAHEALIRAWPKLREWLNEDRDGLRLHRHVTEAAREWERLDNDPGALYRGARLAQATEWSAANPTALNTQERAFLAASHEFTQQEIAEREAQQQRELAAALKLAETERRSARRLRLRNRVIVTIGLLASTAALIAMILGAQAESAARRNATLADQNAAIARTAEADFTRAEAQRLAAEANTLLKANGNSELIALLSLRSMKVRYSPQGDAALAGAAQLNYPQQIFTGHTKLVWSVAFSPDGLTVASASDDQSARLWDRQTGRELHRLPHPAIVYQVAFSSDGRRLLTNCADTHLRLWDVQTGQLLRQFGSSDFADWPVFSSDGKSVIAAARDGAVQVWAADTGQLRQRIQLPIGNRVRLVVAPDLRYVLSVSFADNRVRLWRLAEAPQEIGAFPYLDTATAAAFSPDDAALLIGYAGGTAVLWDVATGQAVQVLKGHTSAVNSVAFSPDGRTLLTGSTDKTVRMWERMTGAEQLRLTQSDQVYTAAFAPDSRAVLAGSYDGSVRAWDVQPQFERPVLAGHASVVSAVAFSPDGRWLATGGLDGVRLWDVTTARSVRVFDQAGSVNYGLKFSPDGRFLLSGNSTGAATLWDINRGQAVRRFALPTLTSVTINDVDFSPDSRHLLLGGADDSIFPVAQVWDVESGKIILPSFVGYGMADAVYRVAFAPDGCCLLTGHQSGAVKLWDAQHGQLIREFTGHVEGVNGVAFSPDGNRIASAGNYRTVGIWDVQTGQELRRLTGHTDVVWSVTFSPDGQTLATASADGTARLWDAQVGDEVRRFVGHAAGVENVVFSPDGQSVATVSDDGTARLWDVDYHTTIGYLCSKLLRDFTAVERIQYGIADTTPTCP